jgi:DNA topoisomerase-1
MNTSIDAIPSLDVPGPEESAEKARLIYVDEDTPGIRRRRHGRGFTYFTPAGDRLRDTEILARIRSLAIPPAWKEVWIALYPEGHIQATGRDARGRKQYIYHPRWQQVRNQTKFDRLLLFGTLLPEIRRRIDKDLSSNGISKERALAFVVRLLDRTLLRIGNREYARANRTYGLTTLHNDHVRICGTELQFDFLGKGKKQQMVTIRDRRLAFLAKKFQELPGQALVKYRNGDGEYVVVDSDDVNRYIEMISGERFTAKDFRTWGATVWTAEALVGTPISSTDTMNARNITRAIRNTARRIGNTLAVCRKYYVHPTIVDGFVQGVLVKAWNAAESVEEDGLQGLSLAERAVLNQLRAYSNPQRLE